MFNSCSRLINLDLRKADFSSINEVSHPSIFAFRGVPSNITITVKDGPAYNFIYKLSSTAKIVVAG